MNKKLKIKIEEDALCEIMNTLSDVSRRLSDRSDIIQKLREDIIYEVEQIEECWDMLHALRSVPSKKL